MISKPEGSVSASECEVPGYYWYLPACARSYEDAEWSVVYHHPATGIRRSGWFVGPITRPAAEDPGSTKKWTRQQAIDLCVEISKFSPGHGCHVALTGGLLYKDGLRKDCDILFYRHQPNEPIDREGLEKALVGIGFVLQKDYGRIYKALYKGKVVDLFFPEDAREDGNYPNQNTEASPAQ